MTERIRAATHRDKTMDAINGLIEAKAMGSGLKDAEVRRKVRAWLRARGYSGADMPSYPTFKRLLPGLRVMWRTAKG
jgi:hypothetical protein